MFVGWCVHANAPEVFPGADFSYLENHSTKYHRQQPLYNTLEFLIMGIVVPETCWASSKTCNKNLCCIYLAFYFHILTTMHGQNHIKFNLLFRCIFKYHKESWNIKSSWRPNGSKSSICQHSILTHNIWHSILNTLYKKLINYTYKNIMFAIFADVWSFDTSNKNRLILRII
jgi:hypothetical protein